MTIPDVTIAFCGGLILGALAVIGLAFTLANTQRRANTRAKK